MDVEVKLSKKFIFSEEELTKYKTDDNTWDIAGELAATDEILKNTSLESIGYFEIDTEVNIEISEMCFTIHAFNKDSTESISETVVIETSIELDEKVKNLNHSFSRYYIEIESNQMLTESNLDIISKSDYFHDIKY